MDTEDDYDAKEALTELRQARERFYWTLFRLRVGSKQHAFIEWCGVMGEHLNMLGDALEDGHDIRELNQHGGAAVRAREYRIRYMGEKLRCILAPFIDGDPKMRDLLVAIITGKTT